MRGSISPPKWGRTCVRSIAHQADGASNQSASPETDSVNVVELADGSSAAWRGPASRRLGALMFDDHAWLRIGDTLALSPRERQIIMHLFNDEKESVIAIQLGISPHTVHMHIERLYRKLGAGGRMNMALRVFEIFLRLCIDPQEQFPPICRNRANGCCPLCG